MELCPALQGYQYERNLIRSAAVGKGHFIIFKCVMRGSLVGRIHYSLVNYRPLKV